MPPGNGSLVVAVHVPKGPWAIDVGPLTVAVGPVLANACRLFGVPTPVGPSNPASASQARSPTLGVLPVAGKSQSRTPAPNRFGSPQEAAPSPSQYPLPPVVTS